MPYDHPLQEQYKTKVLLAGTFGAAGTVGSIATACKDVIISAGSSAYINFGTTAGANVVNSFYLPGDSALPLYCTGGSYITASPVSGTAYVSVIGYY